MTNILFCLCLCCLCVLCACVIVSACCLHRPVGTWCMCVCASVVCCACVCMCKYVLRGKSVMCMCEHVWFSYHLNVLCVFVYVCVCVFVCLCVTDVLAFHHEEEPAGQLPVRSALCCPGTGRLILPKVRNFLKLFITHPFSPSIFSKYFACFINLHDPHFWLAWKICVSVMIVCPVCQLGRCSLQNEN